MRYDNASDLDRVHKDPDTNPFIETGSKPISDPTGLENQDPDPSTTYATDPSPKQVQNWSVCFYIILQKSL